MPLFHLVILAIVQGISEFLPISSSGHLVLAHIALGHREGVLNPAEELTLDIAVHVGTLVAVLIYFRRDILFMGLSALSALRRKQDTARAGDRQLLVNVIVASLPVIVAGYAMHAVDFTDLRNVHIIAWFTIIFGVLLWVADRFRPRDRDLDSLTWREALVIGVMQVIALIPGTSRSGITMTTARWFGIKRTEAARFSLLLALIATSGAGAIAGLDLLKTGDMSLGADAAVGAVFSCITALFAIAFLMKWLQKSSFTPFAVYRIVLGVVLLGLIYGGVLT